MTDLKIKVEPKPDVSKGSDNTIIDKTITETDEDSFETIVNMMQMPKVELDVFCGNPVNFQSFQAVFDEVVHKRCYDDQIKLTQCEIMSRGIPCWN